MPPFTVRRLTSDDVTLMEALLSVFAAAFEEPATYNDARPGRPYLEDLLGGDHFIAVAAMQDGAVVGGLAA